jgi:hypothetical protein
VGNVNKETANEVVGERVEPREFEIVRGQTRNDIYNEVIDALARREPRFAVIS